MAAQGGGLPTRRSYARLAEALREKRLTIAAVEATTWEPGVSRSTMYRLIAAYRGKGTVPTVESPLMGREARGHLYWTPSANA